MAVVFIEGFDHYDPNASSTLKGWSATANGSVQTGRFGGQACRVGTGSPRMSKTLPSSYSTFIAGFAFRTTGIGSSTDVYYLRSSTTATLRVSQDASGHIVIKNSGGTTIATGTTPLVNSVWCYIEVKLVVGTSGTVEVHLNGVSEIASTVGNFGTSNIDNIGIAGIGSQSTDFDDMYGADTTGSVANTFLGDTRVSTLVPTGAGAHTQFTPNGAANNWDCVDDGTSSDGDSTYVSDATVGDIDTYACSDVDGGATVYGVQTNHFARKDDAATRQIAPVVRQGSTDYVGSTVTLASTYTYYSQLYAQDPTSSNWTAANVNGDEFGVKVIA